MARPKISQTANGIKFHFPKSEVHANTPGWLNAVIALAAGYSAGYFAQAVCYGTVSIPDGPAALFVCPAIGGFVGGFVGTLVNEVLDGKSARDGETWAKVMAVALVSAIGNSAWSGKMEPWAKKHMATVIKTVSGWVSTALKGIGQGGKAALAVAKGLGGAADRLYQACVNAVRGTRTA